MGRGRWEVEVDGRKEGGLGVWRWVGYWESEFGREEVEDEKKGKAPKGERGRQEDTR